MINFWKLAYEEVKKQRDQYKQENEELKESFQYQLEKRLEYFKKCQELKEKNKKLERENRRRHYSANKNNKYYKELWERAEEYKAENEQLKEERESMISDYQKKLDLVHMLKDEINELKQELHSIYKENEYLLNIIKMSENIEIHSDAYDEMEKGENNKTHHIPHLTDIKTNKNIEEPMKFIKRIAKERADDER